MILIDGVTVNNFTAIVTGNKGEEQMIIVSSPLRMGVEDLIIVAAQVQGGARVLYAAQTLHPMARIERKLVEWCAAGTRKQMGIEHAQAIADTLNTLRHAWEY